MKYVHTTIREIQIPSVQYPVLEARVSVVDTENLENSPYDKMVSMPVDIDNVDRSKARMFDSLCKLLGESQKVAGIN